MQDDNFHYRDLFLRKTARYRSTNVDRTIALNESHYYWFGAIESSHLLGLSHVHQFRHEKDVIFKMGKFVFRIICRNFTLIFKSMAAILGGVWFSVALWQKERAAAGCNWPGVM